mmetsp:Transcript_20088/g.45391  ORF Transcript_20088/g.45391 Transcript_20088/m.45391 type:complete len:254 (-) Transcript_20088:201-962(-)
MAMVPACFVIVLACSAHAVVTATCVDAETCSATSGSPDDTASLLQQRQAESSRHVRIKQAMGMVAESKGQVAQRKSLPSRTATATPAPTFKPVAQPFTEPPTPNPPPGCVDLDPLWAWCTTQYCTCKYLKENSHCFDEIHLGRRDLAQKFCPETCGVCPEVLPASTSASAGTTAPPDLMKPTLATAPPTTSISSNPVDACKDNPPDLMCDGKPCTCEFLKVNLYCEDEEHGEMARSHCPVGCGLCIPSAPSSR